MQSKAIFDAEAFSKMLRPYALLLGLIAVANYFLPREWFLIWLPVYSFAFLAYLRFIQVAKMLEFSNLQLILWWGPVLLLLLGLPQLSDDYYRFIWDGLCLNNGINPFQHTPEDLLPILRTKSEIADELYQGMNSKQYFSVYPPVLQGYFWFCNLIGGSSIFSNILIMKLGVIIGIALVLPAFARLLKFFEIPNGSMFLLLFNPLFLLEGIANLHFESLQIIPLILFFLMIIQQRIWQAGIFLGLAVLVKLTPLLIVPFLFFQLGWKRFLLFSAVLMAVVVGGFSLFWMDDFLPNYFSSVQLYYQKFEFNGSIYTIVKHTAMYFIDHNPIAKVGPALGFVFVSVIVYLATKHRKLKIEQMYFYVLGLVFFVHLLLSTTVHPWYLITPLLFSVFFPIRVIIVWSFCIFFSYIFYSELSNQIKTLFVVVEYSLIVLTLLVDKTKSHSINTQI